MEKNVFSKEEQFIILKALTWHVDECDSILSDPSLSDANRMIVEDICIYLCGIIRKLKSIFNS